MKGNFKFLRDWLMFACLFLSAFEITSYSAFGEMQYLNFDGAIYVVIVIGLFGLFLLNRLLTKKPRQL